MHVIKRNQYPVRFSGMSKKEFLNEDEINNFLARSDDEDEDSDWDNIGEVDADDYLKASAKPSPKRNQKASQEIVAKRKEVVTFRKSKLCFACCTTRVSSYHLERLPCMLTTRQYHCLFALPVAYIAC